MSLLALESIMTDVAAINHDILLETMEMNVYIQELHEMFENTFRAFISDLDLAETLLSGGGGTGGGEGKTDAAGGLGAAKSMAFMQKAIGKMMKGIKGALGPLGFLITILESLGLIQPIIDVLMAFMGILQIAFLPVLNALLPPILSLLPPFMGLAEVFAEVMEIVMDLIKESGWLELRIAFITGAINALSEGLNSLKPIIEDVVGFFTQLREDVFEKIITSIEDIVGFKLSEFFDDIPGNIMSALEGIGDSIATWFADLWKGILSFGSATWDAISEGWDDFWSGGR